MVHDASLAFARSLGARERRLFRSRWLRDDDPPSLAAIGRDLGLSRERVRQLESRILRRFKEYLIERTGIERSGAGLPQAA